MNLFRKPVNFSAKRAALFAVPLCLYAFPAQVHPHVFAEAKLSKKDRVLYQESVPSHAMVFVGEDVGNGKPEKWLVENSWGTKAGNNGLFTMYDSWFDEYMYAVIINRKHLSKDILDMFTQTPEVLPPWDPMFAFER